MLVLSANRSPVRWIVKAAATPTNTAAKTHTVLPKDATDPK